MPIRLHVHRLESVHSTGYKEVNIVEGGDEPGNKKRGTSVKEVRI